MANVTQVFEDSNGYVRSVKLRIRKTRNSDKGNKNLERPASKIVLLVEHEWVRFSNKEAQKE